MKKIIGISFTKTLFQNYWDWFAPADLGDEFELLELSFEKNNTRDIFRCDAFILTGGVDVHPSLYDGDLVYENASDPLQPERDAFEEKIFNYSQEQALPLLAICRGMQLVNVLRGGRLVQDLGPKNEDHKKEALDKEHAVFVNEGSLLHSISSTGTGQINSAHHQAVDPKAIGAGLVPNAYAHDQVTIEGLENADKNNVQFLLCVQWHPERMRDRQQNPLSEKIKHAFLSATRNTQMKKIDITNPATGQTITSLNVDSVNAINTKLNLLRAGQPVWAKQLLSERIEILRTFSGLLQQHIESLADVLSAEVGKPLQQSRNEINGGCSRIQWLTDNAAKYLSDEIMNDGNGMVEKIVYEPLGVVGNISAWNYPYLVGINVIVPALLAGNSVLYKPSEFASLTGLEIERLLLEAGVPADVFRTVIGGGETGSALLDLPLDGYFFTGSYKTGKYIYEKVAARMVPCQCELGGKDPLYVADDVGDVAAVAAGTADGAFYNNGQSCCAVERIYVHEKIYDQYVDEFVKEVRRWKMGNPDENGVYIGPLTRPEQLSVLKSQLNDAREKGAVILTGGAQAQRQGNFFEPTVLVNVNHSMTVMREESFGPVIGIMKVKDDNEALALMQDTPYGLTASVYSSSQARAERLLQQINAGTGYWNCCDRVNACLPWSGRKNSGFGATLSHAGLRAFTKPKAYHLRAQ